MNIEYKSHYFDNPKDKASFKIYAKKIFGLDFSLWESKGLWEDSYLPFSAFAEEKCIATICVYPSEVVINKEHKKAAQLLTVGTLPEFRLQGIQRELWDRAHRWIRDFYDFTFLFTDETAVGFYEKLGLRQQIEFLNLLTLPTAQKSKSPVGKKLDLGSEQDYQILFRLAHEREMVSEKIGLYNPNLLLFMFLYCYGDFTYYLSDLDCIIAAEEKEGVLRIHDVVTASVPAFDKLELFFKSFGLTQIEFLFCPDKLGLSNLEKIEIYDSLLVVCDNFKVKEEIIFPYSARA